MHAPLADRLRPGRHGPARLADRPLQPALLLLHAGRGARLAARRRGAHRRRGRPADHDRRRAPRRHARSGSPAASRWSAAAWSTSCGVRAALDPASRSRSPPTRSASPGPRTALADAGPRPGQRQPRHRPPRDLPRDHPARPARRRRRRARGRARPPGSAPVKVNAVLLRGVNDDQARRAARVVPRARLRAALHRADAAGRPARLEPRRRWSPPTRSSASLDGRLRPHARRRAAGERPGRAVPRRRRPGHGRASSPRSPGRSAATATGSGSPPTARSATACSPARSPTCARRCGPAPPTRRSPTAGWSRWRGKRARARHRRPVVPPARPADVRHRRLAPRATADGERRPRARAATSLTGSSARRGSPTSDSRCSSQASQTLRRSGVCSFGLFHSSAHDGVRAGSPWPSRCRSRPDRSSGPGGPEHEVVPDNHGGSCPAPHATTDGGCSAVASDSCMSIAEVQLGRRPGRVCGRSSCPDLSSGRPAPSSSSAKPSSLRSPALAMTTATYGRTQRAGDQDPAQRMPASDATIAPTKQTVRMPSR